MSGVSSTLSALVSAKPSLLAYSIPLLMISIPLMLAGTFLTLDRSRSFPSSYTPTSTSVAGVSDHQKKSWISKFSLQGGIGGLASGYVFGVHLSTFLSVMVPAMSSSAVLSSNAFMAVWILSCIITTILGGRYRYCARIFAGLSGGPSLALAICVMIHPPLLPRQILTGLFAVLSLLLIMVVSLRDLLQFLRPSMRVFTASAGAFSLVLSIALLAHVQAWADVWQRLWLSNGDGWGTSQEKGLTVAFFVFFGAGIVSDFLLHRRFGECPDENWDNYLANYSSYLPNDTKRAGSFRPLPIRSLLDKFVGLLPSWSKTKTFSPLPQSTDNYERNSVTKDSAVLFSDDIYGSNPYPLPKGLSYDDLPASPLFQIKSRPQDINFQHKKRGRGFQKLTFGRRQPIKFGLDLSSDSSDDEVEHWNARPWLNKRASTESSSPTLVEATTALSKSEEQSIRGGRRKGDGKSEPVYSDYEQDIGIPKANSNVDAEWRPEFIKRHSSTSAGGSSSGRGPASSTQGHARPKPIGVVPATPSLIKALDRVTAAQKAAYGPGFSLPSLQTQPLSNPEENQRSVDAYGLAQRAERDGDIGVYGSNDAAKAGHLSWEDFWKEVRHKAMASS
ncbi:hypothetical protein H0H92_015368 [Tricholoma furcatifolium]|nr:hypothetical protein H0H92_015368 [Tricholoma furcatifolium]